MCTILEELSKNYKFVNKNANVSLKKDEPLLSNDDYKELNKVLNENFSKLSRDEAIELINALLESEGLLGSTVVYIGESEKIEKLHNVYVELAWQLTVVADDNDNLKISSFIKGLLEKITVEVIVDKIKEKISDIDMSGLFELLVIKHIKENENDYITA